MKILFFCLLLVGTSFIHNVQSQHGFSGNEFRSENKSQKMILSTISCHQDTYISGTTVDLDFLYHFISPDNEFTDGIAMQFPTGVIVNSATIVDAWMWYLPYNGETGNGALVTWGDIYGGSEYGEVSIDADFSVNVTISDGFSGDLIIDWFVAGDGFGLPPHTSTGSIIINQSPYHDLAVTNISPIFTMTEIEINPIVRVKNLGSNSENEFTVSLTDNNGYDEEILVNDNIDHQEFIDIEFPAWISGEGEYVLTASVDLAHDEVLENNHLEQVITVFGHKKSLSYFANTIRSGFFYLGTPELVEIFNPGVGIRGGVNINNQLYAIDGSKNFGYFNQEMDTWNLIGNTGLGEDGFLISMAYSIPDNKIFTILLTGSYPAFNIELYEINIDTGIAGLIGQTNINGTLLAITADNSGELFGIMHNQSGDGELYHINKDNAELTLINELDAHVSSFFQAMTFDVANNDAYFQAYHEEGGLNGTYLIDLGNADIVQIGEALNMPATAIGIMGDFNGPLLISKYPDSHDTNIASDEQLMLEFNVDIFEVDFSGIEITPNPGNINAQIQDNLLLIDHDDFDFNTLYTVTIAENSISNGTVNNSYSIEYSFTTGADPSLCNSPLNFVAEIIDFETVILEWVETGPATDWIIEYGQSGFNLGEGSSIGVSENPYQLEDLTANTNYDVYVKSVCSIEEESIWTGPLSFTTVCTVVSEFPWTETFENNSPTRNCWYQEIEQGFNYWSFANGAEGGEITHAYQGEKNAKFSSSDGGPHITKLISPELQLTEGLEYKLDFYYAQEEWEGDQNELKIYYRISQSDPWIEIAHYDSNTTEWTYDIVELPNPGGNYQIAFEGIDNFGRSSVIDNVRVRPVSDDNDILAFSFDEQTGEQLIDIIAKTVEIGVGYGFNISSLTPEIVVSDFAEINPPSGSTQDFSSPFVYTVTSESGIDQDWTVTVTVADEPSSENDIISFYFDEQISPAVIDNIEKTVSVEVAWHAEITNLIPYFEISSFATVMPGGGFAQDFSDDFNYFVIAQNNDMAVWTIIVSQEEIPQGAFCSNPYYLNLPADAPVYEISQTTCNHGNSYSDFDCGGAFFYGEDIVYNVEVTEPINLILEFDSDYVPLAFAILDDCPDTGSCVHFSYFLSSGENTESVYLNSGSYFLIISSYPESSCVESFNLTITVEDYECLKPIGLYVNEVSDDSAEIIWDAGFAETQWNILFEESGFNPATEGILIELTGNPYVLTNLEPNTEYDVYVQAVCENDALSYWAGPLSFTTEVSIDIPDDKAENSLARIYPNPSDGLIFIEVDNHSIIRIFDISGRIIEESEIYEDNKYQFNGSAGMYLIEIMSENLKSIHKVVIR